MRSVWMHPWDLEGTEAEAVIARLRGYGLNAAHLAVAYHGGRMLLPSHPQRRVMEHQSGVFLPLRIDAPIQPHGIGDGADIRRFVRIAAADRFPIYAWLVLGHNDRLGSEHPDCCVRNVFGDIYSYALCPAHPDVQQYFVGLCSAIAVEGFEALQLEALSFLGYEHQGLHEKQGVPVSAATEWLLSVCACPHCRAGYGVKAETLLALCRAAIDCGLAGRAIRAGSLEPALRSAIGEDGLARILGHRRTVILSLLDRIRSACRESHISLRMSPSPLFVGGKTGLRLADAAGRVNSACLTFFARSMAQMRAELESLESHRHALPLHGGFIFHHPDCRSREDVRDRIELLKAHGMEGIIAYCHGMAGPEHWEWLAGAARAAETGEQE